MFISGSALSLIFDVLQVRRAIQFLHDLGTVQYFDNEFLRDNIVINPQWIVDVMACVVSINSPIQVHYQYLHREYTQKLQNDTKQS